MIDQASTHAAADRIRDEFGQLDVLANNAGIAHAGNPAWPLAEIVKAGWASVAPLDEVRAVSETNVFGVVAVTQALLPLLHRAPAVGQRDHCVVLAFPSGQFETGA